MSIYYAKHYVHISWQFSENAQPWEGTKYKRNLKENQVLKKENQVWRG